MENFDKRLEKADTNINRAEKLMKIAFRNMKDDNVIELLYSVMDTLEEAKNCIDAFIEDPEDEDLLLSKVEKIAERSGRTFDEIYNFLYS